MANFRAIAATSAALLGLIRDFYPRADFGTALDLELYESHNFHAPMADGISLFLYRVTINGAVRNLTFRRTPDGKRVRPSLPVDLYYLLTPWAQQADRQQRMLGWAMRFFEDLGVLSASQLNHFVPETNIFAASDGLEIICEPLQLPDYLNLWDRLHRHLPPSMSYVVRMLMIDSEFDVGDGPLVQTRQFRVGDLVT